MIYNVILYIICGIVIGSWISPLYSIVTYAVAVKMIDFFVEGFDRAKGVLLLQPSQMLFVRNFRKHFENGITMIDAKGYYSGSKKDNDLLCNKPFSS